jgi:hypothetical protein
MNDEDSMEQLAHQSNGLFAIAYVTPEMWPNN